MPSLSILSYIASAIQKQVTNDGRRGLPELLPERTGSANRVCTDLLISSVIRMFRKTDSSSISLQPAVPNGQPAERTSKSQNAKARAILQNTEITHPSSAGAYTFSSMRGSALVPSDTLCAERL